MTSHAPSKVIFAPPLQAPLGQSNKELEREVDDLRRALRGWLGSGPIDSPTGAFYAWLEEASGRSTFEYPEITGYALTYLMGRPDLSSAEIERGLRAANWLQRRLERDEFSARDGWDSGAHYSFDLGMIATGLILFGRRCESERHISAGIALAEKLRDAARSAPGLSAILDGSPSTSRKGWSTEGRPHLLKVVQSLLLAEDAGLAGSREAAALLVEEISALQRSDGSFPTQPGDEMVMLHPHLYTIEGLWIWSEATGDASALAQARDGMEWVWESQLPSGGFPRAAHVSNSGAQTEQGDATSQTIRMTVALGLEPEGFEAATARLLAFARPVPGGAALIYQPESQPRHHNAWVTMFGAQALEWALYGPSEWSTLV